MKREVVIGELGITGAEIGYIHEKAENY